MEVIGTIASFIAIGRVLQAIPTIISVIRELPEMKQEFMSLVNELETLRAIHAEIENLVTSIKEDDEQLCISPTDSSRLWASKTELEGLLKDLQEFCAKSVSSAVKSNKGRFKPLKWLWGRKKAGQLRDRARGVRLDLQLCLAGVAMKFHRRQTKLLLEIREISYSSSKQIANGVEGFQALINAEASKEIQTRPLSPVPTNISTSTILPHTQDANSHPMSTEKQQTRHYPSAFPQDSLRITTSLYNRCPPSCSCQCHSQPKTTTTPSWFKPLLGSLMLSYNTTPIIRTNQCNLPLCQRQTPHSNSSLLSLTYHFPTWLCGYCVSLKASIESSLTGYGAYIHATIPRLIPQDDAAWHYLLNKQTNNNNIALTCRYFRERAFLPTDELDPGYSLLSAVIAWAEPPVLMALLNFWAPILHKTGISEYVFTYLTVPHSFSLNLPLKYRTETTLAIRLLLDTNPKTHPPLHSALSTLLSFSSHTPPPIHHSLPPLHQAILSNNLPQLQYLLLHTHPSQLTSRDSTSWTPFHHAAFQGNPHALQLLLSASPKSIIIKTSTNDTPLHCAVAVCSLPCIRLLLSNPNCDVTIQNTYGNIPIQLMISDDATEVFGWLHVEIIRLLLQKSPKTLMRKTRQGRSIVNCLVANPKIKDEVFERLLDIFIEAGGEEEIKGLLGYAISRGIKPDRLDRLMKKGGAKLNVLFEGGENILHVAARWAGIQVLEWLLEKVGVLKKVDHELVVKEYQGSPWDTLRYFMSCEEWDLLGGRRPSREEVYLFGRLFSEVRNMRLKKEIELLRRVLKGDEMALENLMGKSGTYYRVLGIQIREGMWDGAVECVEENIEVCLGEMGRSPWEGAGGGGRNWVGGEYSGVCEQFEFGFGGGGGRGRGRGCPLRSVNWRRCRLGWRGKLKRGDGKVGRVVVRMSKSGKLRRGWMRKGVIFVAGQ
ncbi:hypothetical protein QBC38DRAFT_6127 [Podospora fimiseda]|uniref:Ankyrin n=1 Tax=Podospora fimiseda TaxID=252190 RepID=A0AAN7C001_9PEZI|nr:hypothetical protein QBC38DRAFT_6127 [Podospora fimiseda]